MAKRSFSGKRNKEKASSVKLRAYKFRGYPDEETEIILWNYINGSRGFWNILCAEERKYLATKGMLSPSVKTPGSYKKDPHLAWLRSIDSLALANVQQHFETAKSAFRSGDAGRMHFKKKGHCRNSYTTNCSNASKPNLTLVDDLLKLPKVPHKIRLTVHREIEANGRLKSCTVAREGEGWYFSLLYEYDKERISISPYEKDLSECSHIGLDMSLPNLYVDSNGDIPDFIKPYRAMETRLKKEQQRLSRKERANIHHYDIRNGKRYPVYKRPLSECKNYQKQKRKVERIHARIKHMRDDMLHKLSAELTDCYDIISIEDLNMKGIIRSLRLAKSASDIGWAKFVTMLTYKQERKGHVLIKADRFFASSRTCSVCGNIHKELKLSDRVYVCPHCGSVMDRDHQAAVNIDREGLRLYEEFRMAELSA